MPDNKQYQRVKEITDQLEQGIQDLFNSEQYMTWLRTMSRFHDYSLNNTLLIAFQRPDATLVAGYTAWQKQFGRQVQKGEKAIHIIAPTPYKEQVEMEKIDPATQKPVLDADGNPVMETQEVLRPAFKVVNVFDVSQTEGRELPSIGVDELTGDVERYEMFFEALKRTCPVPMEFEQIKGGAKGYYHQLERRIALQEGMSQLQTIKTAIHEMAHQKLHAIAPDQKTSEMPQQSRNSKEVEAESVAYTVCQHFGIDSSDYSFAYIAGWSHGKDTPELKASLQTIRKSASEMITEIEGHMTFCVSANDDLMAGEMSSRKLHSKLLCAFRSEPVILFVAGIKTDDIVMSFDLFSAIVLTVLSVQTGAFTAICFGRTVDAFKHDKLPPDHLAVFIKDRFVRELIMLKFEIGQRVGIADIFDGYVLNESHIPSPILRCSGSPFGQSPEAHDAALLPEDLSSSLPH